MIWTEGIEHGGWRFCERPLYDADIPRFTHILELALERWLHAEVAD